MQTAVPNSIRRGLAELHLLLILRIRRREYYGHSDNVKEADAGIFKQNTTTKGESRGILQQCWYIHKNAVSQLQIVQALKGAPTHEFQSITNIQHTLTCDAQPLHATQHSKQSNCLKFGLSLLIGSNLILSPGKIVFHIQKVVDMLRHTVKVSIQLAQHARATAL